MIPSTGIRPERTVTLPPSGRSVSPYSVATQAVTETGWVLKKLHESARLRRACENADLTFFVPSRRDEPPRNSFVDTLPTITVQNISTSASLSSPERQGCASFPPRGRCCARCRRGGYPAGRAAGYHTHASNVRAANGSRDCKGRWSGRPLPRASGAFDGLPTASGGRSG